MDAYCFVYYITGIMLIFGKAILQLFGASNETIIYATGYMNIYCLGTLFTQLTLGLNAFITVMLLLEP